MLRREELGPSGKLGLRLPRRQQQLASIDLRNLPEVSVTTDADVDRSASVGADWGIEIDL